MQITFINNGSGLPTEFVAELEALLSVVINIELPGNCEAKLFNETLCISIMQDGEKVRNFCLQAGNAIGNQTEAIRLEEVSANLIVKLGKQYASKTICEPVAAA